MNTFDISLSLVDDMGRLQTKPFLLEVKASPEVVNQIYNTSKFELRRQIFYIPGYSDGLSGGGFSSDNIRHYYDGPDNLHVSPLNYIGSLIETLQSAVRIWFHKYSRFYENLGDLELNLRYPVSYPGSIQMEYIHDWSRRHEYIPSISWTHSSLYRPDCFSCMMGVRELMNAIEYCKGKIVTDRAKDNDWGGITIYDDEECLSVTTTKEHIIRLASTDDILSEFAKWFTSSFQGTLETAHVDDINFITPDRIITKHLGY